MTQLHFLSFANLFFLGRARPPLIVGQLTEYLQQVSKVCARFGLEARVMERVKRWHRLEVGFHLRKVQNKSSKKYFGVGSSCEGACQEMFRLLSANLYFHFSTSSRGKGHTRKMGTEKEFAVKCQIGV